MTTWRHWQQRCAGVGVAGAAGVAALAASAVLYGVVQLRHDEVSRLASEVRAATAKAAAPAASKPASLAERLKALNDRIPKVETLQDWIERIEAAAAQSGVDVERADYRLAGGGGAFARYHITLPMKGSYPQLRALVAKLLETVPTLALANVDLKRDAIGSGAVDARVELVLFLRRGER